MEPFPQRHPCNCAPVDILSFEHGDHHACLLLGHSICVEVYATYFQQELGDVVKEGVGDVPGPAGFRRLRVLPKVSLGHFRGEDVEMTFPGAAKGQLFVRHGVGERATSMALGCAKASVTWMNPMRPRSVSHFLRAEVMMIVISYGAWEGEKEHCG